MDIRRWDRIYQIHNDESFLEIALELFRFQYAGNAVYARFAGALGRTPETVRRLEDIPFLPISFFRDRDIITGSDPVSLIFESSSTTSARPGRHLVAHPELYERSFMSAFRQFYGDPSDFTFLALLPSYLERGHSSLVYMAEHLIRTSTDPRSGFYLNHEGELIPVIEALLRENKPTILLGVTFALLDFAERHPMDLGSMIVMDTGGMKGRKKEMVREELHGLLKQAFGLSHIHSEYGMTELLSQSYAIDGIYQSPPWKKVLFRDETDPLSFRSSGSGALNVIDLANVYSCSFIATQDLGRGSAEAFEVLGRMDHTDIRGCSLMAL